MKNGNGILRSFDLPDSAYAEDVLAIKEETIRRYGAEEWRVVVMTNEIHGHLGIYSTLGAKMGQYALSLLGGEDRHAADPKVVSFAGLTPPISCMNDGLQMGCGATLGHGLISVSDEERKRVEATFEADGKLLRLALKPEYEQQIAADIRHGVELYGHTPAYWLYVRQLAIRYWAEWDRNAIFCVMSS